MQRSENAAFGISQSFQFWKAGQKHSRRASGTNTGVSQSLRGCVGPFVTTKLHHLGGAALIGGAAERSVKSVYMSPGEGQIKVTEMQWEVVGAAAAQNDHCVTNENLPTGPNTTSTARSQVCASRL